MLPRFALIVALLTIPGAALSAVPQKAPLIVGSEFTLVLPLRQVALRGEKQWPVAAPGR